MEFDDDIPQLATDGRNWSIWREKVEIVIEEAGLHSYLDGTVSEPDRQLEAMAKLILTIGLPDSIFGSMLHLTTAHDYYKYLTNRFEKSAVQPLRKRLREVQVPSDAEPQVAARKPKGFNRPCRKCGERGHKARECKSAKAKVENNPPEGLPSTSLEGGRTGARDELSKVRIDESRTTQPTWMPHDEELGGEFHEVAMSHEEAARVDVEGGEVGEEDGKVETSTDETAAATSAPSQSSMPPEGREGQATTGNAGASVHQPNGAQTASPRRHDGATTSVRESAQSAGRADSTSVDCANATVESGGDADSQAETGEVKGHGGGYRGGRGSGDGTTNDASAESRRLMLKALATDRARQRRERLANESDNSPEPPEPPDDPAQRRTQSPSVELEGERRAASSCDVERTISQADASGAPEDDGDDRERPTKLQTTLERVRESSERKGRDDSPREARVEQNDPDSEADASAASGSVEDVQKKPKNLRNASEHERKCSKRRSREVSPDKARGDPDRPDGETAVPGDFQRPQERPRSVSNERVDEANAPRRRNSPGSLLGEPEASRGVEGVRDRGTVVDSAEHDRIGLSSDGNERFVETSARSRRTRPGGHMGESKASRDVEGDGSRESDGDGVGYHGERGKMDGVTSGARGDSKRVDPRPLADREGQRQRFTRNETAHVPEPSTPPTNDHKRSTELPNPPRRRGKLKSRTKRIRRSKMKKSTYRIVRPRRGQSKRIKRIGDVAYEVQMLGSIPARYRRSTTLQRSRIQDCAHSALPEPRLTIYGHRSTQPLTDAGLFSSFIQY
jgi:hypothetical protein